jgi:MFS family permease
MTQMSVVLLLLALVWSVEGTGKPYTEAAPVVIHANKVGPFANPSETYRYYQLPFCQPKTVVYDEADLGQILRGDRLANSLYDLHFKEQRNKIVICHKQLDLQQQKSFRAAIDEDYYFELVVDELPMFGFIGETEVLQEPTQNVTHHYLFTHLDFSFSYNTDRIVVANVSTDSRFRRDISGYDGTVDVAFTYSVSWTATDDPHAHRIEKFSMSAFRQQHIQIHWLSIINSFVLVLLLTGFLAIILMRILHSDINQFAGEEDPEAGLEDESGWKQISGDVFRVPPYPMFLSALLGMGAQFLSLVLCLLSMAALGTFYPYSRGAMHSAFIALFAVTACIAGFVSSRTYKMLGGEVWVWNIIMTGSLFAGPLFVVALFCNLVALSNESSQALPFVTIIKVFLLWALVSLPLTIVGGIAGRRLTEKWEPPCRQTKIPREIPGIPWYRQGPIQLCVAGFLPFSAIYIELHYIFASVWGYKLYTLYGVLFLVFLILLVVTSFITIALTYFQLAVEDHRWWWRSFFSGGSSGLFVYVYCFFYYFHRSEMYGFLQASFFFGYMAVACYSFTVMMGYVGFFSAFFFVRNIYKAIKSD